MRNIQLKLRYCTAEFNWLTMSCTIFFIEHQALLCTWRSRFMNSAKGVDPLIQ